MSLALLRVAAWRVLRAGRGARKGWVRDLVRAADLALCRGDCRPVRDAATAVREHAVAVGNYLRCPRWRLQALHDRAMELLAALSDDG